MVVFVKDPEGRPAVDLAKLSTGGHHDLVKRAQKAGIALSKRGLSGVRAQARVVLDFSGSMRRDYQSGAVQTLIERALGFSLQIDVDGRVPITPFDTNVRPTVIATTDNYQGIVDREIWPDPRMHMGTTNMAAALQVILDEATRATEPTFCIVVADGGPDSKRATTKVIYDLAGYPVFLKLLAVRPVAYFQTLDDYDGPSRLLDNCDTKTSTGDLDLLTCTDLQFAEAMADEWDTWIDAAHRHGILT